MTVISAETEAGARAEATQALISAGRTLFTRVGYRQTGFADIAERAGLTEEYARDLLPGKAAVFGALIERTVKVAGILGPAVAGGPDEDLPARLARTYLALWEPNEEESPMVELYRVAFSDKDASQVLRERVTLILNGQVDRELPGADAELRTALFGAQLGGVAFARHIWTVDSVAAADLETVIGAITPGLRRTLLASDAPE
ncbi:TetR family transcriptional regulator [Streptomyces sp. NPDC059785]|uniref:TetR/AcrR family transcriptional regulator n=1 Tax=Streptomyces sp. NPDC059785 TaxID=3346945 RepID=UPI00366A51F2